jgi:hypothetical protein
MQQYASSFRNQRAAQPFHIQPGIGNTATKGVLRCVSDFSPGMRRRLHGVYVGNVRISAQAIRLAEQEELGHPYPTTDTPSFPRRKKVDVISFWGSSLRAECPSRAPVRCHRRPTFPVSIWFEADQLYQVLTLILRGSIFRSTD